MITRAQRFYLQDLLANGQEALSLIGDDDDEALARDRTRWLAIERLMISVGEAAANTPPAVRALMPEVPWHKVKGMRDILVHQYWEVSQPLVSVALRDGMPPMIAAVECFLAENPEI